MWDLATGKVDDHSEPREEADGRKEGREEGRVDFLIRVDRLSTAGK